MFSKIFISRPRLAAVISIVITLAGLIAILNIPVAQYPSITPPEIRVSATYPGANAQVVADTVAAPIEAEVNGVENMLYMNSTCSNDGRYSLAVTFAVGTDPDLDQVNLQNRVQVAMSKLPQEVTDQGVTVRKRSSDMLGAINFYSPNGTRETIFMSNYVSRIVKDELVRIPGVSDVMIFGEFEYSIRVWMQPDRLTALGLTADDVMAAIRQQNIQAAVGSIGAEPVREGQQLQYTLTAQGRLSTPEEFERIIVRTNPNGGLVRIRDIARVELGANRYSASSVFNGAPCLAMAVYRSSEANSLDTMREIRAVLKRMEARMPEDVAYNVFYDTTKYVSAAIEEIVMTLLITFLLVVGVTYLFLQDWRALLVPTIAIPVSLIGTFAVLLALGYSANTISLFALIMAIGLVVDDAIVVVENVYRIMAEEGLSPWEASVKAMGQVTGPIVATTLVLLAVFVPVGFLPGITGQLYRQFAVTMCTAVLISSLVALTLSPALCAVLLKKTEPVKHGPLAWFNRMLESARKQYVAGAGWLIRRRVVTALVFLAVLGVGGWMFSHQATSFLPPEDQGAFLVNVQLPESAALSRTGRTLARVTRELKEIEGVDHVMAVSGFSLLSGTAENVGFGIVVLAPWNERNRPDLHINAILGKAQQKLAAISTANIFAFAPPPIQGLGNTSGFDFRLQALGDQSAADIAAATQAITMAANQHPALARVFSTYTANTPQLFVDLDRTRAESLKVPVSSVFSTLQANMGGAYVNDFNLGGRVYQVKIQADADYRNTIDDIGRLYVRSTEGKMIPLGSLITLRTVLGAPVISRYNQFQSVQINGEAAPGFSSGEAMAAMTALADTTLPKGYKYDWSGMSYQERKASGQIGLLFGLAFLFAYLFLAGQYESWTIPGAIIASLPVASLGALAGLRFFGFDLSIYAQIGLVLLVGLASKNAILIVEFCREQRAHGLSVVAAALEGAKIRFRPVLMTAFTFILGIFPMVIATGAGAGSRRHIGTTVFWGMVSATFLGIFLIPVFYYAFQSLGERFGKKEGRAVAGEADG